VSFQQVVESGLRPPQNPTSGGVGGSREWTVKDGDSLASIAYAEYGDSNAWRPIADVNRLTQVRRLRPGTVLEIPGLG
jgi:nucleoid-associated protein YgaU